MSVAMHVCVHLSVCLPVHLYVHPSVCLCMCVRVCVLQNKRDYFLWWCVLLKMKDPKNQFCVCFFFLQYLWKKKKRKNERKKEEKFKKSLFVCFLLIFWCLISKFYFLFYLFGFEWLSARQKVNLRSYNCSLFLL